MRDSVTAMLAELDGREAALQVEFEHLTAALGANTATRSRIDAARGPLRALLETLPAAVRPAAVVEEPTATAAVPDSPAPQPREFLSKARRVDVPGRQPDPFALNQLCIVCEVARFHRNGPRQKVCPSCRAIDPRISVAALRALYRQMQDQTGASQPPTRTGVEQACVGPALDESEPCPLEKRVQRTNPKARGPLRCPDCYLESHRRRTQRRLSVKRAEDRDLAERIDQAAPPALAMDAARVDRVSRCDTADDELETVWNGGEGLTSHQGGSSLRGAPDLASGRMP